MKLISKKKTAIEFNDVKKLVEQEEFSDSNGLPLNDNTTTIESEFEEEKSLSNPESDDQDLTN